MTVIETLSEYCGIVEHFIDARGDKQTTTTKTRRALLAAMGVPANDEDEARKALAQLQRKRTERSVPTVCVHYQTSGALEIDVGGTSTSFPTQWRIELESGEILRGLILNALTGDEGHQPAIGAVSAQGSIRIADKLPCGYHTLVTEPDSSRCSLIVTPGVCWLPAGVEVGRKFWGLAIQLYLLRSEKNWGIGDFGDLQRLTEALAAGGADAVGLNPLHALFPDDPRQASPYSPASRLLLNILNIDVGRLTESIPSEAVHARLNSPSFQQALERCRHVSLVDYPAVAALKLPVLEQLFECLKRDTAEWRKFVAFRATGGPVFERGCLFLALRRRFAAASPASADWHQWPAEYRRADAPESLRFEQENAEAVTFQAWMQFVADSQLSQCSEATRGMAIGLYRDLAVGASPAGAETWANPAAVADAAQVGAPPDIYNPQGQNWGLPPFNPQALQAERYQSFIDLLRANMRHAGGIRIDHVMALQQLYWVPKGSAPADGAYVRYPLEDLVGILALESMRNKCLVVGEDLGTVPEGFRERMARANILSYRVLFFEKTDAAFISPEQYPQLALAVAGSHDLPTLRAWWRGSDLSLKESLALYPTESLAVQARESRKSDREALVALLRANQLVGPGDLDEEAFVDAAHALLARTRSMLTMLQIDDLTSEVAPVNVPTTSDEHPNWRRRQSMSLEQFIENPRGALSAGATHRRSADPSIQTRT
jgi:4-alpha-glucanotransferase